MKKIYAILISIFSLVLSGCGTIPLPSAPNVYSFDSYADSKTLGVSRVHDLRGSDKAGNVCLYSLKLERGAFEDFVTDHLLHVLNKEMKLNVIRVGSEKEIDSVDFQLKGTVEKLDVFSIDSLLDPAEAVFHFNIVLLDASGEQIYTMRYEGKANKWIGLNVSDKVYGQMVDNAVKDVFQQVTTDEALIKLLNT
ncbi:hypothetical protein ACFL49_00050 [Candidatus Omnitrophota bacterium]